MIERSYQMDRWRLLETEYFYIVANPGGSQVIYAFHFSFEVQLWTIYKYLVSGIHEVDSFQEVKQ